MQTENQVSVEEMRQRLGRILGEEMGNRWSITGDGECHIFVSDLWADNDFVLTIERMPSAKRSCA